MRSKSSYGCIEFLNFQVDNAGFVVRGVPTTIFYAF